MSAVANSHLPLVHVISQSSENCHFLMATLAPHFRVLTFSDVDQSMEVEDCELADVIIIDHDRRHDKNYTRFLGHAKRLKRKCPGLISMALDEETIAFRGDEQNVPSKCIVWPSSPKEILDTLTWVVGKQAERSWQDLPAEVSRPLTMTVRQYQGISDAIANGEPIDGNDAAASCRSLLDAVEAGKHHTLLKAVQSHHDYTYVHSMRVATLLTLFGCGLGVKGDDLLILSTGGLIHDVGKLATPEHILNKPGKLDEEEWPIMRDHVVRTLEILDASSDISKGALIIAGQHHEKLDGSGYPHGLKGAQLNEVARMSAIVDIFGALTDKRSYKPAYTQEKAFGILESMSGQIDQKMLKVFRGIFGQGDTDELEVLKKAASI